jgi:hypothetical protein
VGAAIGHAKEPLPLVVVEGLRLATGDAGGADRAQRRVAGACRVVLSEDLPAVGPKP